MNDETKTPLEIALDNSREYWKNLYTTLRLTQVRSSMSLLGHSEIKCFDLNEQQIGDENE